MENNLVCFHSLYLRPQAATNRLCGVCWARLGTCPIYLFARHGANFGASKFAANSLRYQLHS